MLGLEEFSFVRPSPRYRELILLTAIRNNPHISQAELATLANVQPSMVNNYISQFESEGIIVKKGPSKRKMTYHLTPDGEKRLQVHLLSLLGEASQLFLRAKEIFRPALDSLEKSGISSLLLYGAGDVGTTVCRVLLEEEFKIIGFVDDDPQKHGKSIFGIRIMPWNQLKTRVFDACMVTSYRNADEMKKKAERHLKPRNIPVLSLIVSPDGRVSVEESR